MEYNDEFRNKMRQIRLQYMKEHPEETAWRKRNKPSYPEKCFIDFLKKYDYDKKYLIEREKSVFPYFIDFAFTDVKLAIEIDGSQHLQEERKENDIKKDKLLTSKGWKILRISENLVKTDWETINNEIQSILQTDIPTLKRVGIVLPIKGEIRISKNGKTYRNYYKKKENKNYFCKVSKENKPSLEELYEMKKTMSNIKIGKLYNVSEACVRKWIKNYKKEMLG